MNAFGGMMDVQDTGQEEKGILSEGFYHKVPVPSGVPMRERSVRTR